MKKLRVVSLIPSSTEIVCALGLESFLVGRSHECDFPRSVRKLPVCTEPTINVQGSSAQIDHRIQSVLEKGLSVYRVDAEQLRDLSPDVIVTQTQCEVCAVTLAEVETALQEWTGSSPCIVSLEPNRLDDIWEDIRRVAQALDAPEQGEGLVGQLQKRLTTIADTSTDLEHWPTVACIEWIEPLMAAGNWIPELVEMAGGQNLFGKAGVHSPRMTWDELVRRDPEILALMPCGYDIEKSHTELRALLEKPEWPSLGAVRQRRVYLTDGNQYFNRPGPRLVESLEILAELVHPEIFSFGHEGTGWERA